MHIEIYKYKHGWRRTIQYGWRLVAANGENMSGNKGFNSSQIAKQSIKRIYRYYKHAFRVSDLDNIEVIEIKKK